MILESTAIAAVATQLLAGRTIVVAGKATAGSLVMPDLSLAFVAIDLAKNAVRPTGLL